MISTSIAAGGFVAGLVTAGAAVVAAFAIADASERAIARLHAEHAARRPA